MKKVTARQLADRISWDQMFDNEQELIAKMLECNTKGGLVPRGYMYIRSFKRYYSAHGCLTPRQLVQLKRLAKSIYAFYNKLEVVNLVVRI